ncbi:MAG: hypothetical protein U0326_09635 [Polyangiales bacterium]
MIPAIIFIMEIATPNQLSAAYDGTHPLTCMVSHVPRAEITVGDECGSATLADQDEIVFESHMHGQTASSIDTNAFWKQLDDMRGMRDGWDEDGAPAPNESAISGAKSALALMLSENLCPHEVDVDVIGGVAITVHASTSSRSAWFVFPNQGRPHVVLHGDSAIQPRAFGITADVVSEVRTFLGIA